jgi:quercetin dioxygenase-like cupin family protein
MLGVVQTLMAQMPNVPAGVTRTQLLDNASALVARLKFEPAAAESIHTHPFSAVMIQLTAGDVQMTIGSEKTSDRRTPGFAWFIPNGAPHAAVNVGTGACEFVTVAIKPGVHSSASNPPAAPAVAGIDRTPVFDNAEARAAMVSFQPGAREVMHSHAYDLVLVQLSPGRVETALGSEKTTADLGAGTVQFLPHDVSHAVANVGAASFELMSVALK